MSGKRRVYPGQTPGANTGSYEIGGTPTPTPFNSQASMNQLTTGMQQMNIQQPQQQFQQLQPQQQQQQQQQITSPQFQPGFVQSTPQSQPQMPGYPASPPLMQQQQLQQQIQPQPQQFQQIPQQPQQFHQPLVQTSIAKNVQMIGMQPNVNALTERANTPTLNMQNPNHEPIACPNYFKCSTLNNVPKDYSLLQKSKMPLGLMISPFKQLGLLDILPVLGSTDRKDVNQPVYNCPAICRCRRCRAYINPYIEFVDNTHWRCNFCFLVNELPSFFDYDVQTQQYVDRFGRPELKYAMVEYVAPAEYMVRAPQPPVYVFLIDVSSIAVQSGSLHATSHALADLINEIPNEDERVRVSVILFDSHIHFIAFDSERNECMEYVIGDLDDVFLPVPDNLLISLSDCKSSLSEFFRALPQNYSGASGAYGNCLGSALQAAYQLISNIGGKILTFIASIPNKGNGNFQNRNDPKLLNTAQESKLLQPQNSFYKGFAIDCSRAQITVDYFAFGTGYLDLSTLNGACRFTSGTQMFYPGFSGLDFEKFGHDLARNLTRPLGLEAVLRVRCTKGIRSDAFHGNFFVRSSDLLALPTVSPDNAYAFQLTIEEPIQTQRVSFQTALLYTTSFGERRIRVLTICCPVATDLGSIFSGADQRSIAALLSKMAVERALTSKLEDARDALINKLVEIVGAWRSMQTQSAAVGVCLPENMTLLPLFVLSLLKNAALGICDDIDKRFTALDLIRTLSTDALLRLVYPRLYEIHAITGEVGTIMSPASSPTKLKRLQPDNIVHLPVPLNLTSEKFVKHGVYLLDAETIIYLWVSRQSSPALMQDLFGKPFEMLQSGKYEIPILETAINQRVRNIVTNCRSRRWPSVVLVKDDGDPMLRNAFLNLMVEDRTAAGNSYITFIGEVRDKIK